MGTISQEIWNIKDIVQDFEYFLAASFGPLSALTSAATGEQTFPQNTKKILKIPKNISSKYKTKS